MHRRSTRIIIAMLSATLAAGAFGCASSQDVQLTTYADPFFPERGKLTFGACTYRLDAGGDLQVCALGDAASEDLSAAGGPRRLDLHLFWKPRPGVTPDEPTTIDAVLRIATGDQTGSVYRGTAYAYVSGNPLKGERLKIQLEQSRLRSDAGRPVDAKLIGVLRARRDDQETVNTARIIDRIERPPAIGRPGQRS